ncbi:hypothetical protein Y1Q_0007987 [Alligator mississippiensis]|uniref:Uncharacterized protein n=1 Tax=Alligator mississippiensis TaxID=8496 RepID=A0A151NFV1_ALLMI|nr:hypothetical protein Y1Q_0007987 [Alligator mississippiensis]
MLEALAATSEHQLLPLLLIWRPPTSPPSSRVWSQGSPTLTPMLRDSLMLQHDHTSRLGHRKNFSMFLRMCTIVNFSSFKGYGTTFFTHQPSWTCNPPHPLA